MEGNIELENDQLAITGDFEADKYEYHHLTELTEDTYFIDNTSTATYEGEVNTYGAYDTATISMDIDFGATANQITNGNIDVLTEPGFRFAGSIDQNNHAYFVGTEGTFGAGGGEFYGNEANIMKGGLGFTNGTNGIAGDFEASKK